jgi:predicted CXXCH cytochrome family protein
MQGMAADKPATLCASCHPEVSDGMKAAKSTHAPAAGGECIECHNPHQTPLPRLLLAKSPDLCLGCHKTIKAAMDEGKVHPPAAKDCLGCHKPHSSGEPMLLVKPVRTLCGDCHDVKAAAFGDAHLHIDPAVMHCERCHDPHASKQPHFFKSTLHPPFEAKTCEDCHLASPARIK